MSMIKGGGYIGNALLIIVFLTSLFGEPTCFRHSWQYPFS
jgi:hypothetical protein